MTKKKTIAPDSSGAFSNPDPVISDQLAAGDVIARTQDEAISQFGDEIIHLDDSFKQGILETDENFQGITTTGELPSSVSGLPSEIEVIGEVVNPIPELRPIERLDSLVSAPLPTATAYCLVIPYLASKAKGAELVMAVRAWEKNLPGLARVVIIGDLPAQLKGKVTHIPHKPESTNPQIDVAQKMAAAIASELVPEVFIWSNDDIFPLAPLTFEDIAAKKCMSVTLKQRGKANGIYRENTERTVKALAKVGITDPKDYATHTPVVLEKSKLAQTLAQFKCTANGHLVVTLYYNTHFPDARPISMDNTAAGSIVASVWKPNPNRDILDRVMEYKQYINCNDNGWPHVERHLLRLFPKKSKFEN